VAGIDYGTGQVPIMTPEGQPKKKSWVKWVVIGLVVFLLLSLMGCGLVSCLGLALWSANTEDTSTNTNGSTTTDAIELNEEERAYVNFINTNVTEFNDLMTSIGARATEMGETNFAITDDMEWLRGASDEVQQAYAITQTFLEMDEADVPSTFREAHGLYQFAMSDYALALDHFLGAGDGRNEEALGLYADYISSGSDTIIEAHIAFATARDGVAPDFGQ
jgi:hypothetical protein